MDISLTGVAQAILKNISGLTGAADAQLKITPQGFLQMLLENNAAVSVNNLPELQAGQNIPVKVRYMQRGLATSVTDTDSCSASVTPAWKEATIDHSLYSQLGLLLTDDLLRTLQVEATRPSGQVNVALMELLSTQINAIVSAMNTKLVTAQASKFGKNAAYSTASAGTAQSIVLSERMGFNEGLVKLQHDMFVNEVTGPLLVCGNGRILDYQNYNRFKTGVDAQGFGSMPLNFYADQKTASLWGADHFGVFEPGTIGLVTWNRYKGVYAGQRGNSMFFTLPVPVALGNGRTNVMTFDCQLFYNDCPSTDNPRGYRLILSQSYGLFNLPTDAYYTPATGTGDVLSGVTGAFRYVATAPAEKVYKVNDVTPDKEVQ